MSESIQKRETISMKVENLYVGCHVDLASCPYLNNHSSAASEYALVVSVEIESEKCVVIGLDGIDSIGYPVGTDLAVVPAGGLDPCVKVRQGTASDDWSEWRISQKLTDRWGDINDYEAEKKPLQPLEDDPELLKRLRAQMWPDECFIVRKDGVFGVLFEVEYCSNESEGRRSQYEPHSTVVENLLAAFVPLREKYPGVLFSVPEEIHIMHERPAVWAFVADGLISSETRDALGEALIDL